ncbi:protein O-mannosyl-transferase TMTC4-like isoform X1 [Physella acuta]|uniref:protein O-mannosyl-transferase TMTC4-like isoform X1 n=1 Tax=Physella acuta TaxID=109671 RepID=UPI0027DCFD0A|nr:protein O-mannosyl-transferase TMTC4-like isoform X1 [Physella acuta]XP_059167604.1 protein O-mannosyl-transferase TMTC4-like isoform X1 [Physella acuta]XP_059167605.1 protein O-mannosyl-transferase TMTC4-like isoform X1 [Physella acuta]XP_059167606.1 protein O-mannosyl-transferase TMTC4-like isoform X1 [Physella acuta]XP_059167607.1 protein O-mannosyl-transferase TMTC4-like isoform X1 [Physella acuta]XP_059167608.1 protein O-mannosyl-transferase TMTC4-like isoform X1 [Physella acuta]
MADCQNQQKMLKPKTFDEENLEDELPISVPRSTFQAGVIIFMVAVLCFVNSYDGEFVFDDTEAIENNKDLLPSTPISNLLENDFWGRKLSNLSHKSYRPITVLTFRWNYWAAGGLYPKGFHIVNILLHGFVCVLLMPAYKVVLSINAMHSSPKSSLLCSLLFAVHPVHTESVAGVVGRADLLCALFFILSFLMYVKGITRESAFCPSNCSYLWIIISMSFCACATFSKEQGITVIGICSAYDILAVCKYNSYKMSRSYNYSITVHQKYKNKIALEDNWKMALIKRQLLLTVSAVFLLVVRWRVMGSAPPIFQIHDNPHSFVNGTIFRAINYNYLYAINSWILLSAHWLCFDWSMGCIPTITSVTDPRILVVCIFWIVLLLIARRCLCLKSNRSLILAVLLIAVPFLPASNILFRVGFVVAERVLYIPSAGFCILIVLGLKALCKINKFKHIAFAGFVLLLLVFFLRSIQRSSEWRRGISLFKSGEKVCPLNAKVHYNIGKLSADSGNTTLAQLHYRLAIKLNPMYDQAMNNLANILKDNNLTEEAEQLLDKAVSISSDFAAAWMNRGIVKAALKKFTEAEFSYKRGIHYRKNYPDCYYNLGNLYLDMGRSQDALEAWHNATVLKPTHWNSWNNAIILLDNLNQHEKAASLALVALRILPNNSALKFSLANVYGKQEKYNESEKLFHEALRGDPQNANIYLNLGVLYHRWGRYSDALLYYKQSFQLNPQNSITQENMKLLQSKLKSKN